MKAKIMILPMIRVIKKVILKGVMTLILQLI